MYNEYVKSPDKSVTFCFFIALIAFIYIIVQLNHTTQPESLSKEVAVALELEKAPEMKYIGKGSTHTLGNHHYYEMKMGGKSYFIQTNESRYHFVQYFDVTNNKEDLIKEYKIILN